MQIKKILLTGFLCAGVIYARAQEEQHAAVAGHVISEQSAPVAAAAIYLSPGNKSATTDASGAFHITAAAPGKYMLHISAPGYKGIARKIVLTAGRTLQLEEQLKKDVREINTVSVTGVSKNREINRQAYNVLSVDARPLHNSTMDLGQVLNRVSGVRVRESGGVGSDIRFSLNGFSGRQVKFFLDGMPMDNFGSAFQLNNIPVNFASRIEIYKGVVPVWLGGDALGGAVNIITNTQPRTYADVSYSYGSFNTHKSAISAGYTAKSGFTLQMNAFQNYSDNNYWVDVNVVDFNTGLHNPGRVRRFHDRYHNETLVLYAGVTGKKYADQLLIGGTIGKSKADIQTGNRMEDVFGGRWRSGSLLQPSLKYLKRNLFVKGFDVRVSANFNLGEERAVDTAFKRYNWAGEYEHKDTANPNRLGGESSLSDYRYRNNNGAVNAALSYTINDRHAITFNELFTTFNRKAKNNFDPESIFDKQPRKTSKYISGLSYRANITKTINATAFAKHYFQRNITHSITDTYDREKEVRYYDVAIQRGSFSKMGYGLAATWFITPRLQLKSSYEKAFRLPENEELFGDMVNESATMDLRPESSHNVNIGANYSFNIGKNHAFEVQGDFIFRNTSDYIRSMLIFSNHKNEYIKKSTNDESVTNRGIDAEIHYRYKNRFSLNSSFTYQNIRNQTEFEMLPSGNRSTVVSAVYKDRIPNVPYMFGNTNAAISFDNVLHKGNRLSVGYNLTYVNQFYLFWPSQGTRDTKLIIPTQWGHDVNMLYALAEGKYNIGLECLNIGDSPLFDNYRLQKPGRAFYVKLRYYFSRNTL
ncbi:TonB-dependent receptor [Chitinophaga sp. Mgbs1]|uniref:TonB-dependent receptor n=1 Tax=Chitinophaga solisilvae TaxID=1233460 RepID=A0A433WIE6_9BACT|nr:TonB-dependent receptor [Chitinophaga solisilvae]